VAVIVAALIIAITGFAAADALASAAIGLLILPRTWNLLREAVDILLEATPKGMDLDAVRRHLLGAAGVADIHDLHAWTITSGLPVISAHVVLAPGAVPADVLAELSGCLSGDFDVEHSALQLETSDRQRIGNVRWISTRSFPAATCPAREASFSGVGAAITLVAATSRLRRASTSAAPIGVAMRPLARTSSAMRAASSPRFTRSMRTPTPSGKRARTASGKSPAEWAIVSDAPSARTNASPSRWTRRHRWPRR
jgi:hypothetical protein